MRALLDTHALLWWLDGDTRLSKMARDLIADEENSIFVSTASAWEITTKVRIRKLPGAVDVAADFAACVTAQGFSELVIGLADGVRAGSLPGPLRDPFDRMLIAQARLENLTILTVDRAFRDYDVAVL